MSKSPQMIWEKPLVVDQEFGGSKQAAMRIPLLWCSGCSLLLVVYCFTEGCMPLHLLPSFQSWMGWAAILFLWTTSCSLLFVHDVYHSFASRVLRPALVHLQQWSLDDILRLCLDPQHFISPMIAFTTVSASMYTILPTTPEQRARIFQSMGLLPQDEAAVDILATPGGWMQLLYSANGSSYSSDEGHGDDGSTTQETEQEPYFPYSISPIYREQASKEEPTDTTVQVDPAPAVFLESPSEQSQELHEILGSILYQHAQQRFGWDTTTAAKPTATLLSAPTTLRLTALVSTLVLGAQLRYSATARAYCKTILHLLVTATSGTALCAALVGLGMSTTAPTASSSWVRQIVRLSSTSSITTLLGSTNSRLAWKGGLMVVVLMLLRKLRRGSAP